jgi:hypothetical protein
MAEEEEQEQEEYKNKCIRPRDRARGQKNSDMNPGRVNTEFVT